MFDYNYGIYNSNSAIIRLKWFYFNANDLNFNAYRTNTVNKNNLLQNLIKIFS